MPQAEDTAPTLAAAEPAAAATPQPAAVPLRRVLARLIGLATGPLVVLAAVLAVLQVVQVRRVLEHDGQAIASQAAQNTDRAVAARISALQLLASARSVVSVAERERGYQLGKDFERVYGSPVIMADPDGNVLFHTRQPLGQAMARLPVPRGRSASAQALATGAPAVGDLFMGPVAGKPLVAVAVPVRRNGEVVAVALTLLDAEFLRQRIHSIGMDPAWSVMLRDSLGGVIARDGAAAEEGPGSRAFKAAVTVAPWQAEVSIPASAYWRPLAEAAAIPLLALLLAVWAGVWAAGIASRHLQLALRALDREPDAAGGLRSGIEEVDGLGQRLAAASKVLHDSERSYRLLFEAHPHPMWVAAMDGHRFLAVNEAALRHYGYSLDEFLAMDLMAIRPPQEAARLKAYLAQPRERTDPRDTHRGTWIHLTKSGRRIEVEVSSSLIEFEGRQAMLVLAVDVTERNALARAQEEVRDSSARALTLLRDVLARVDDGFVALDRQGVYTYANQRAAALLGVEDAKAILGRRKQDVLPDVPGSPLALACSRALHLQQPQVQETYVEATGVWLENRIYPSEDGLSIYFSNITERRAAQQALVQRERDFRVLSEQIPAIVYRIQLATGQLDFVSPRIAELGYPVAQWTDRPGRIWEVLHPDDRPRVEAELRQALDNFKPVLHMEYRMRDVQGQWHYMSDHAAIVRGDEGMAPFMLGVIVDVTDTRLATAALRRSELQYRRLAEQVPAIIYRARVLPPGPALYVSPHISSLGYTVEQWTSAEGPNWTTTIHPEDLPRVVEQRRHISPQMSETTLEYRLRDAWGRWRHFIDHARMVEEDEPGRVHMQGVLVEITFLKLTEQALRQAEADQRSLFEAMADGVLVLDADHRITDANAAAATLLGYSRQSLMEMRLQDLLPEAQREGAPAMIAALLASPGPSFAQWDNRRQDGTVFPAEISVRPAGGSRYVKVFRDVTDRRAAEQARIDYQRDLSQLTQRLMSQERETSRHLAQTLHDHLGQSLAVSRLRLDAATVSLGHQMPESLRAEWARVSQSLDQAIADVRLVLGDLRPPMLEEQGLLAALDNEIRSRNLGGVACDVLLELDDGQVGTRWPADVEYCAFMVAREAIVNAQLHADASLVRVIVLGDGHQMRLEVLDDGRGIPDDMRAGRPGHLGLVGMRERALAIGAHFSVERVPEGGTRVLLQWQETLA